MDFRTVSLVTFFQLFWIASLRSGIDLQTEVVGFRTPNPAGYPKCSCKALRSGEYDAHSSAAMKQVWSVLSYRNCCVTFARYDGTLSCMEIGDKVTARDKVDDGSL